ncbi:MAG TPA: dipeptide/oligopeptide/nickel ABC transporter permease/ATP-binding protein [Pseudonocardiaceae bacterium]|jgi:peptide/nickel transport system permease protein
MRTVPRRPLAAAGACWLLLVTVVAVFAPWIAPYGSEDTDLGVALTGPGRAHPLGVDPLGRDELSRLIVGSRVTLAGVGIALAVFVVVGVAAGLVAGYLGGRTDRVLTRVLDLVLAIPAVLVLLAVLSLAPGGGLVPMLAFGVLSAPVSARVVRATSLQVREELYIAAARAFGLSAVQIVLRHVLRRVVNPTIVQAAIFAGTALIVQTGLAFLGFGPRPPAPSWGGSVQDASEVINRDPWLLYPCGLVIALTVLAFGLVGDGLRDASAGRWATERYLPSRSRRGAAAEPDAAAVLLSVRDLTVDAPVGPLIQDVSFDIAPGEALALVGESGCGKSITALATLGVLPAGLRRVSGTITVDGKDVTDPARLAAVRGRRIGYVCQEPMTALDPTFTVHAQLAEAVRHHRGVGRAEAGEIANTLLAQVRIPDPTAVAARYPHQLSGGLAQRACLALALAGDPALLIADEPTTALDVRVQAEILALLHTLRRDRGLAVLLITHDWGVVADQCDRAIVLYAGQIVETGPVEDLFRGPRHPYTQGLLAASRSLADPDAAPPRIGVAAPPLVTIPGVVPPPGHWPTGCRFADRCPHAAPACRAEPIELHRDGPLASRCVLSAPAPTTTR